MVADDEWQRIQLRIDSLLKTGYAIYDNSTELVTIGYLIDKTRIRIYIFSYVYDILEYTVEDVKEVRDVMSNFPVPLYEDCPVFIFKAENGKKIIMYISTDYQCKILNGNIFMAESIPELVNAYEYDIEQARRFVPGLIEKLNIE